MFTAGLKAMVVSGAMTLAMAGIFAPQAQADNLDVALYLGDGYNAITIGNNRNNGHFRYAHSRRHNGHGYRHGSRHNGHGYRHGRRNFGHRKHGRHHQRRDRYCSPRRAIDKAWNMGLKRPHVSRVGDGSIVVKGRRYGHRVRVVFSRWTPWCEVIKVSRHRW